MNCENYYILSTVYSAVHHIHDFIILHTPSLNLFFGEISSRGFLEQSLIDGEIKVSPPSLIRILELLQNSIIGYPK